MSAQKSFTQKNDQLEERGDTEAKPAAVRSRGDAPPLRGQEGCREAPQLPAVPPGVAGRGRVRELLAQNAAEERCDDQSPYV